MQFSTIFQPDEAVRIPEATDYSSDASGNIWSHKTYKQLKTLVDHLGYLYLKLYCNDGKRRAMRIHQIVARCYVINPDPDKLTEVDHIDRNKKNPFYINLRWVDRSTATINKVYPSSTGYRGVTKNTKGYRARVVIPNSGGKELCLGTYPTKEEAHAVRLANLDRVQGEFGWRG